MPPPPLDLTAAVSLTLHRRLARGQAARPCGLTRPEIEALGEERQRGVRRAAGWVARLVERAGGEIVRRPVSLAAPDAPLLVADGAFRFAIFLPTWPDRRAPGSGEDWTLALALGHLALHWATLEATVDEDTGDGPLLYVPHFAARGAAAFPARLEAMWYAAALLMPVDAFRSAWSAHGGNPAAACQALGCVVHPDLAATRAEALGLSA